ncbi:hypothetical protein JCM33374_g3628 [Metschnikowia sp. JCM 33374]|nr:hypothetical protein JCM33374_g3628 [Metschnikowia sp. JCM 33374]
MFRTIARQTARASPWKSSVRFNTTNFRINTESHVFKYLNEGPKFVKFTNDHEWLAVHDDNTAFIGITDYAANALGDTTFVELPEVGVTYEEGESVGSVESVKSASEIYSPVTGEVIAVNETLESKPQLINVDPMGSGWIAHIKLTKPIEEVETQEGLMDEEAYMVLLNDS